MLLTKPLEEDPSLPIPASGRQGLPWLMAASLQSLPPSSHGQLSSVSSSHLPSIISISSPLLIRTPVLLEWGPPYSTMTSY